MFIKGSKIIVLSCYLFFAFILFTLPVFANNNADTNNSTISVSTGSVPADGSTTATISITVKDNSGNTLSGDHVTLTSTSDPGLTINSEAIGSQNSTAATDMSGNVTFTVKSNNPSPGTVTFTAADTSDSPSVPLGPNGSVTVTFTPSALAQSYSCSEGAPGSTPHLTSAVANGKSQITLTWTDAADPVTYYLISYGIASGKYIYGNPNVGGHDTTSYTVSNLAFGTTYYFVVKAVNGCKPGSFSNEISATTTGGVTATPISTQTSSQGTSSNTTNKNGVNPTDTPAPTQNVQPTAIPSSIPTQTAGLSKTRMLEYIIICIFIFGGIGIFISWKYNKGLKKPEQKIEEDQKEKDFTLKL
jgi:hypothetical protein